MNPQKRIFAFHLLNDRSGSPKVLSQHVKTWINQGVDVFLYTNVNNDGFLSNIEGVQYIDGWYFFKKNPWMRLLYYSLSQVVLMVKMARRIHKTDVVYVNTVLPFGAAIIGKIKGANVIYHVHESTVNPAILRWFLLKVMSLTADKIINVSKYVQKSHGISSVTNELVYNKIDKEFLQKVITKEISVIPKNVMMVCSLKVYKGINEFVLLANDHPDYDFKLVLNASQVDIEAYFRNTFLPSNLTLFSSQKDLHALYHWADVIVNLSKPDGWIETFGLTIIEGMAYGLPAIVPSVGGILEVIQEGITGYSVDCRDRQALNDTLQKILSNTAKYKEMSDAAKKRLAIFC